MTHDQLRELLAVDADDIIQQAGPFKDQPLFVAYFWFLYISGYIGKRGTEAIAFEVRAEDRMQFPALANYATLHIAEQPDESIRLVSWTLVD